jgi:hypothetical protein
MTVSMALKATEWFALILLSRAMKEQINRGEKIGQGAEVLSTPEWTNAVQ